MVQLEHLGDDLVAVTRGRGADLHRAGLELGIGLGHHLVQVTQVDDGKALLAQHGLEQREGLRTVDRTRRFQRDLAAHARVDHEGLVEQMAEGANDRIDLGILEIEVDLAAGDLVCRRLGRRRKGRYRGCHQQGLGQEFGRMAQLHAPILIMVRVPSCRPSKRTRGASFRRSDSSTSAQAVKRSP